MASDHSLPQINLGVQGGTPGGSTTSLMTHWALKLSEKDRRVLKRTVISKKRTTAGKVTAELNQLLDSPVSMVTVKRHLHKQNIYGRAAIPKPLVADFNAKRVVYSGVTLTKPSRLISRLVIWSDELFFTLLTYNRMGIVVSF
ncbi:uncharacterized protein TNCV_280701 [Trichonephila clavipes]|nr:uncharacterized protein TNCV_280701 [Trichonephila clavipes]